MNVKRFTARTSRDALMLVRQALGDDAVVLSTKPSEGGVEVLAMAPEGMKQIERMAGAGAPHASAAPTSPYTTPTPATSAPATMPTDARGAPAGGSTGGHSHSDSDVDADVNRLSMSTLSFQDYVRDRMLRRRQASMNAQAKPAALAEPDEARPGHDPRAFAPTSPPPMSSLRPETPHLRQGGAPEPGSRLEQRMSASTASAPLLHGAPLRAPRAAEAELRSSQAQLREDARLFGGSLPDRLDTLGSDRRDPHDHRDFHDDRDQRDQRDQRSHRDHSGPADLSRGTPAPPSAYLPHPSTATSRRDQDDMMSELRSMKGLIEERFGALAFMEKLNRQPAQARLTQKLLDCGMSPALIRKIGDGLPMDVTDELGWAAEVLERNLMTAEAEAPLEDQGGVYALVGATGVGKTTTTAKIAAAFAAKYGANNLGLITLDAYRIGAHEQLRAYGRILGVPVHTAHDRASLEDLLELLAGKKMVLIDTAGMAQRDARTRELLDMLSHRVVKKLLVINAASQGETIEDVLISYHAAACAGIVLSKMDEAVKLGPALDALIRMKLKVIGVANGQRVPEDWHRLSANALIHRALRGGGSTAYKLDPADLSLLFTAPLGQTRPMAPARQLA